jgi:hypothetical protein
MASANWIKRLDLRGKIACLNLAWTASWVGVLLWLQAITGGDVEIKTGVMGLISQVIAISVFPVGWMAPVFGVFGISIVAAAIVCATLNAYFWGQIGSVVWRRRVKFARLTARIISRCEKCSRRFPTEQKACPACGTTVAIPADEADTGSEPTSMTYIFQFGILYPIACGGLPMAFMVRYPILGVPAGALLIWLLIRVVNRWGDPMFARLPTVKPFDAL